MKFDYKAVFQRIKEFITHDLQNIPIYELTRYKAIIVKIIRIVFVAVKGFQENQIQLRASSLTLYSLLSIVPMLAMGFGISKGFGIEKLLISELEKTFAGQKEVLAQSIEFANKMLDSTKGGMIAGIGLIVLFYTVMKLFMNIEESFNNVWNIKKARTYIRKFTDYFSLMLIAPIFLITASSATVFITSKFYTIAGKMELIQYIAPYIIYLFKYVPYVLIWILLMMFYIIMPNTKVTFKSAMIAGIIAGTAYQLTQWGYIKFQIGVSRYNAIYGSFAALPLFIIWLQLSWMIILAGAKISYAVQYIDKFECGLGDKNYSAKIRRKLALLISHCVIKNFSNGEIPYTAIDISEKLQVSQAVVKNILNDLTESRILTEVKHGENNGFAYHPALDINRISIGYILNALDKLGENQISLNPNPEFLDIDNSLQTFDALMTNSESNKLLKDV